MIRTIVMGIVMAFALGFVGCRSCLSPYEHCQPTFIPERGDQCMGELYRCGSTLGGMDRSSNATGDCETCGNGNVEYYSANGYEGDENVQRQLAANSGTAQNVDASTIGLADSYAANGNPYTQTSYNAPQSVAPQYSSTFDENDFSLRDDSAEYGY